MLSFKFTSRSTGFFIAEHIIFIMILVNIGSAFAASPNIANIENTFEYGSQDEYEGANIVDTTNIETANPKLVKSSHASSISSNSYKLNRSSNNSVNDNDGDKKNESFHSASRAKLIVLNKITTKSSEVTLEVGETKAIGGLSVELHKCVKGNDPLKAHNWMLLSIFDNKVVDRHQVFSGWVLSSNQSLSTLEHPVYEVIPRDCLINHKD